jgi:hypothetical protein
MFISIFNPFLPKMFNAALQLVYFNKLPAPRIKEHFHVRIHSSKPKVEPMQDTDGKENRTGHQEPPHGMTETRKDVREPRCKAQ